MGERRSLTFYRDVPWVRIEDPRIWGWAWAGLFVESNGRVRVGTVVVDQSPRVGNPGAGLPIISKTLDALDIPDVEREANKIADQLLGLDPDVVVDWKPVRGNDPIATIWMTLKQPGEGRASVKVSIGDEVIQRRRGAGRLYRLTYPPPRGRIPDVYLARVVKAYHSAVEHGLHPAPTIADDVGAKVNTVRSWIKKARARGLMPPGQRGQLG